MRITNSIIWLHAAAKGKCLSYLRWHFHAKLEELLHGHISIKMSSPSKTRKLRVLSVSHDRTKQQTAFESSVFSKTQKKKTGWQLTWKLVGFFTQFCSVIIWELVSAVRLEWNVPWGFLSHFMTYNGDIQLQLIHGQMLNFSLDLFSVWASHVLPLLLNHRALNLIFQKINTPRSWETQVLPHLLQLSGYFQNHPRRLLWPCGWRNVLFCYMIKKDFKVVFQVATPFANPNKDGGSKGHRSLIQEF